MEQVSRNHFEWRQQANCLGADPNVFFPERPVLGQIDVYADARKVCGLCRVRKECLVYAMSAEKDETHRYGMWGGKTPRQRDTLQRRMDNAG